MNRMRWSVVAVTCLILVLLITVFGDLIVAVGTGIALACVLFMLRIADLSEERTRLVPLDAEGNEVPTDDETEDVGGGVYAKHVYGPLFFGFATGFREISESLPHGARALIVDLERVPTIDQSGLYALEDVILALEDRGVEVLLASVAEQPLGRLRGIELVGGLIAEAHVFDDYQAAVTAAHTLVAESAEPSA